MINFTYPIYELVRKPAALALIKDTITKAHTITADVYQICNQCIIQRFKRGAKLPTNCTELQRLFKDAFIILSRGRTILRPLTGDMLLLFTQGYIIHPDAKKLDGPQQCELRRICDEIFPRNIDDTPYSFDTKGFNGPWLDDAAMEYAYNLTDSINNGNNLDNFISELTEESQFAALKAVLPDIITDIPSTITLTTKDIINLVPAALQSKPRSKRGVHREHNPQDHASAWKDILDLQKLKNHQPTYLFAGLLTTDGLTLNIFMT